MKLVSVLDDAHPLETEAIRALVAAVGRLEQLRIVATVELAPMTPPASGRYEPNILVRRAGGAS